MRREGLLKLLRDKNSDCAKFLKDKVGVSASRIARTVRGQRAFDGTRSTITMGNAGLVDRGDNDFDLGVSKIFHPRCGRCDSGGLCQADYWSDL